MQSDAQHQLGVRLVRYLEVMGHVEQVERQRGQLAGVTEPVGARTSADDHVRVADSLDLVDVVQVDTTVELRVQLVEKLHHLPTRRTRALTTPAVGHWGTCPLDFQQLNFYRRPA